MTWAWKLTPAQRLGMTSRQCMRYHLLRLQIGNELTHIRRGGTARPLAPPEEVLALRPDLKQRSERDTIGQSLHRQQSWRRLGCAMEW